MKNIDTRKVSVFSALQAVRRTELCLRQKVKTNKVERDSDESRRAKLKRDVAKWASQQLGECMAAIHLAASSGERRTHVHLATRGDANDEAISLLSEMLVKRLTRLGYGASVSREKDKPFGSDPMYPDTVFHVGLEICW